MRSQAISYFFAIAQIAGAVAPALFGALIGDGSQRGPITVGYFLGAAIMIIGGIVTFILGVDAERQSLEDITDPISLVRAEEAAESGDSPRDSKRGASKS